MIKRKGKVLKPKEASHERKFVEYAKSVGCKAVKFKTTRNDPDRQVLCPGGRAFFIEFKRDEGETPRDGQINRAKELAGLGFQVCFCFSFEQAQKALDHFLNAPHSF
jgi:hypothetical protein